MAETPFGGDVIRARELSLRLDNSVHAHGGSLTGLMMKTSDEFRNFDGASPVAIQGLALELLAEVSRNQSQRTINSAR